MIAELGMTRAANVVVHGMFGNPFYHERST